MRFLGFIFVVVLILAVVGYFRDWFSVSTSHAGGKTDVTLEVNSKKLSDDTKAAADGVGDLSAKAADAVKSLGNKAAPAGSKLEGTLTTVDVAARDLQLNDGTKTHDVHVPSAVPIMRAGESVGFEALRPAIRVMLSYSGAGDRPTLTRIDILP